MAGAATIGRPRPSSSGTAAPAAKRKERSAAHRHLAESGYRRSAPPVSRASGHPAAVTLAKTERETFRPHRSGVEFPGSQIQEREANLRVRSIRNHQSTFGSLPAGFRGRPPGSGRAAENGGRVPELELRRIIVEEAEELSGTSAGDRDGTTANYAPMTSSTSPAAIAAAARNAVFHLFTWCPSARDEPEAARNSPCEFRIMPSSAAASDKKAPRGANSPRLPHPPAEGGWLHSAIPGGTRHSWRSLVGLDQQFVVHLRHPVDRTR